MQLYNDDVERNVKWVCMEFNKDPCSIQVQEIVEEIIWDTMNIEQHKTFMELTECTTIKELAKTSYDRNNNLITESAVQKRADAAIETIIKHLRMRLAI